MGLSYSSTLISQHSSTSFLPFCLIRHSNSCNRFSKSCFSKHSTSNLLLKSATSCWCFLFNSSISRRCLDLSFCICFCKQNDQTHFDFDSRRIGWNTMNRKLKYFNFLKTFFPSIITLHSITQFRNASSLHTEDCK